MIGTILLLDFFCVKLVDLRLFNVEMIVRHSIRAFNAIHFNKSKTLCLDKTLFRRSVQLGNNSFRFSIYLSFSRSIHSPKRNHQRT